MALEVKDFFVVFKHRLPRVVSQKMELIIMIYIDMHYKIIELH